MGQARDLNIALGLIDKGMIASATYILAERGRTFSQHTLNKWVKEGGKRKSFVLIIRAGSPDA